MEKILIVSSNEKGAYHLTELLKELHYDDFFCCSGSEEAKKELQSGNFLLIMINAPLSEESGVNFALFAAENTTSGILFLAPKQADAVKLSHLEESGILVLEKPFSKSAFHTAVRLAASLEKRLEHLQSENIRLQKQLTDLRLIHRAKCILIQYLNMSEKQAHHYIEKQSMDLRQSKTETALNILKTYEN